MQRIVWKHFALVAAVFLLFQAAMWTQSFYTWPHRPSPVPWTGITRYLGLNWPGYFIGTLPAVGGIAVALLDLRAGAMRVALTVAVAVLAVMVVFDLWGNPALGRAAVEATHGAPTWPLRAESFPLRLDDTTGVLQRSVALLRGQVQPGDLQPWPPKQESNSGLKTIRDAGTIVRIEAARTLEEFQGFFLPFINIGLVLGITSWVTRRARFERQRDARVLRVVAAWVTVLYTGIFLTSWMQAQNFYVSSEYGAFFWLYAPLLPVAVLAGFGWRSAARTAREAGA
ncbi:MAG TPA: hypothetical protein VFI39_00495 [Gemmatimonadales bacterium]|nr:hypothetical protein [Gemmatimonadales bacterium]